MHIRFASQDAQFIEQAVAAGYYANETELVRDAVRRLREAKVAIPLYAAISAGVAEIAQGKTVRYTPKTMDGIKKRAAEKVKQKKPFNSAFAVPSPYEN